MMNMTEHCKQCFFTKFETNPFYYSKFLYFYSAQREAVPQVIEIFQCEICEKQFKLEKTLIKHLSTKHDIEFESDKKQSFKCKHCDKQYSTDKLLDKHIQCHGEILF